MRVFESQSLPLGFFRSVSYSDSSGDVPVKIDLRELRLCAFFYIGILRSEFLQPLLEVLDLSFPFLLINVGRTQFLKTFLLLYQVVGYG